jgi:hypothetical protein
MQPQQLRNGNSAEHGLGSQCCNQGRRRLPRVGEQQARHAQHGPARMHHLRVHEQRKARPAASRRGWLGRSLACQARARPLRIRQECIAPLPRACAAAYAAWSGCAAVAGPSPSPQARRGVRPQRLWPQRVSNHAPPRALLGGNLLLYSLCQASRGIMRACALVHFDGGSSLERRAATFKASAGGRSSDAQAVSTSRAQAAAAADAGVQRSCSAAWRAAAAGRSHVCSRKARVSGCGFASPADAAYKVAATRNDPQQREQKSIARTAHHFQPRQHSELARRTAVHAGG